VTRLQVWRLRNLGSIPERDENFISLSNLPDRLWDPLSLPHIDYRGIFPGGEWDKVADAWRWPLTPSITKVRNDWSHNSTPFSFMTLESTTFSLLPHLISLHIHSVWLSSPLIQCNPNTLHSIAKFFIEESTLNWCKNADLFDTCGIVLQMLCNACCESTRFLNQKTNIHNILWCQWLPAPIAASSA